MSRVFKKLQTCESVCPRCKSEVEFTAVHALEPEHDCFLGSYICKCNINLMMDYEVASQAVIARTYHDWLLHHKKQLSFSEALDLVKKGKNVTRAAWDDDNYLYLGKTGDAYPTLTKSVPVLIVRHRGDYSYYAYDSDFDLSTDLLADDWMLYEETPNEH